MSNSPSLDGLISLGAYNYLLYVTKYRDFIYATELRNDMYYLAKRDLMRAAPILPSDITMTEDEFFAQAFSVYHQHFNYDYASLTQNQFDFISTYYRFDPKVIQEIDSENTQVTLQIIDFNALLKFWTQLDSPTSNTSLPEESSQSSSQNPSIHLENDIREKTLYQPNENSSTSPRENIQEEILNTKEEIVYQLREEKEVQIQFDQTNFILLPKENFDQFINKILLEKSQSNQLLSKPPLNFNQRRIKFKRKKIKLNQQHYPPPEKSQKLCGIQKKKRIKKFYHKINSSDQFNQNKDQLHQKQLTNTHLNHNDSNLSKIESRKKQEMVESSKVSFQYESFNQFNHDQVNKLYENYNYDDNQNNLRKQENTKIHHSDYNDNNFHKRKKLSTNDTLFNKTKTKLKHQKKSRKIYLNQQELNYIKLIRQLLDYRKRDKNISFSKYPRKFKLSRIKYNHIQNEIINSRKSQKLQYVLNERKFKRRKKKTLLQKEEFNEQYSQLLIKTQQFLREQFNTKQKKAITRKNIQQQLSSEKIQFTLALYSTQLQFTPHTSFRKMDQQASMYLFNALQQKYFEEPNQSNDIAIYLLQQIFSDNFIPNLNYPNHDYIVNGDIRNERDINNQQVRVSDKSNQQTLFNINVNYPYEVATQLSNYDKITFLFPIQGNNRFSSSQENCLNQIISKLTLHKSIWTKESLLRWIENNQNPEKILSQMFYYQLEIIKILNIDFFCYNNIIAIRGRPISIPLSPFTLKPKQLTFFELTERQEDPDKKIIFRITNHFSLLAEYDQQINIDLQPHMSKEEASPYKILVKLKNLTEQEKLINQISIFIN